MGERAFELAFQPAYLRVQERPAVDPDVVLRGALPAFQALFFRGAAADALRARGERTVSGDPHAFERLVCALGLVPPGTTAR